MKDEAVSIIRIRDLVLVTMPADPDDATISGLQNLTLEAMDLKGAKGLVLDLSRVDTLDSYFARTVAETAQMVALMGGETVLAGMSPAVAITATQLGLTLGNIRTALNTDRALDMVGTSRRRLGR